MNSFKTLLASLVFGFVVVGSCLGEAFNPEKDLVAYLPFTEDLLEHSAAALKVKSHGTVEVRERAAYFDGKKSWLDLPYIDLKNKEFAVSMWVKVTGKESMYGLVAQRGANVRNQWLHLMLRGGRQPHMGFYVNDAISPKEIAMNEWTHLLFQYKQGRQEIWVNSQLMCSRKSIAYDGGKGPTAIGKSPNWTNVPSKNFEGYMRNVRFYKKALNVDEVASLYRLENWSLPEMKLAGNKVASSAAEASSNAAPVNAGVPFLAIDGRKLVISGSAGQIYELQATSDLMKPWQELVTLTNQVGTLEYMDSEAPNEPQRFYRIKVK